eukprot:CAMPEP_0185830752 /NCGR_PEP_ID=MMETSP1353-20130828/1061_1 /TAXON_ID=1077150 /ORGANISM="Erythrolobus australicus, Strain CCMP3124" /LENGTH=223 /DNA_ID=CAMNT_0028528725 /DNA_START=93 /DNA_END=764 /DNA_ORIENTATION=+
MAEEYDTYVIFDDENREQKVPNRIKEQVARHHKARKDRKRRNILLFTSLGLLLAWLLIITALGASRGYAYSKPSYADICRREAYSWIVNTASCSAITSTDAVDSSRVAQRVVQCDGSDTDDASTKVSVLVSEQTATRGSLSEPGDTVSLWSYETHNFEAGPLLGSVLILAGFGVRFQGRFNGSFGVLGGYGAAGSSLSGQCTISSQSGSSADILVYDLTLVSC